MTRQNIYQVKNELHKIRNHIPSFVVQREEKHKENYDLIVAIIDLFNECLTTVFLSDKAIINLNIKYYTHLLDMYNIDKKLYRLSTGYLKEVYEYILHVLDQEELFESSSNLFKMITYNTDY